MKLCWEDIDFDKRIITLKKTKNGTVRHVPMTESVYQIFKSCYAGETIFDPSFQVFPSLNPERYIDIRSAWEFALKRARIVNFKFHALRHSCASFLAMSGASQRDIAEILGHKDLRMTLRYSHLTQQHLMNRLERASEQFITNRS